jgi:type IV pilus assembly protein PilV
MMNTSSARAPILGRARARGGALRWRNASNSNGGARGGFTLIEVMVAVGLMTVGALSIMAMQQAATRGNLEARQIGTASEVTNRWVERLRRDALAWVAQGTASQTTYLKALGTNGTTGYIRPAADASADPLISPGFDFYGRPTFTSTEMFYCSFLRLTWVRTGVTMRADVLTWWPRRSAANSTAKKAFPGCGESAVSGVLTELDLAGSSLRAIRASILLRWTQRRSGVAAP